MHTLQSIEESVFHSLCNGINSRYSNEMSQLLLARDPKFFDLKVDPREYSSADLLANDYMVSKFLSKWKGLIELYGFDTRQNALSGWTAAEKKCEETNYRLSTYRRDPNSNWDGRIYLITDIRAKIREILGDLDPQSIFELCEWTTGATCKTKRGVPLAEKMSKTISVTKRAARYLRRAIDPHWLSAYANASGPYSPILDIVEHNRFLTVPKTAKTDRPIAAEPSGNSFLQRGVGVYMRRRLCRHGIRLDKQEDNQYGAFMAYKDSLSTLDLESASDTISIETVRSLLPPDWYDFLYDLRCEYSLVDNQLIKLHKFSSMGNAFTFELETIIFFAISQTIADREIESRKKVFTYGDDIIVDRRIAQDVINTLEFFGFTINRSKSFLDGNFFESCGKHYFKGIDVTPIYQKEVCGSHQNERIRLYNRLYRWSCKQGPLYAGVAGKTIRLLQRAFLINPKEIKYGELPAVPDTVSGDDGFLVNPSWLPRYNKHYGYHCNVYVFRPATKWTRCVDALLAYKLRKSNFSNADPKGREKEVVLDKGVWLLCKRYIQSTPNQNIDWEPTYKPFNTITVHDRIMNYLNSNYVKGSSRVIPFKLGEIYVTNSNQQETF
jgi:hypothetical protein